MKTLRKALERLKIKKSIEEYGGIRNGRLFCISGYDEHIEYHGEYRELRKTFSHEYTIQLLNYFVKNQDEIFVRRH